MNRLTFLCGTGKFLGVAALVAKAPFIFDMGRGIWKDPYGGEIIEIGYSDVIQTVKWEWRMAVAPIFGDPEPSSVYHVRRLK